MKLNQLYASIAAALCGSVASASDYAVAPDAKSEPKLLQNHVTEAMRNAAIEELACRSEAENVETFRFCETTAAMRALNAEELELIAGTYSYTGEPPSTSGQPPLTSIPVTSHYPPPPSWSPPPYSVPPTGGQGEPPSGGGSNIPTLAEVTVEAHVIKCEIKAQPHWIDTEYTGFIYNSGGHIMAGTLNIGNENSASFSFPPGVTAGQILGLVHNHDPKLCLDLNLSVTSPRCVQLEYAPSNPSSSPNHVGDWGVYNSVPLDNTWMYRNQIGLYMVEPDGSLRYYPPTNQSSTATGQIVRVQGTDC